MTEDNVVLGERVTGGLGFEGHGSTPRIELSGDRFETGRGQRVDRDLSEELTGCGGWIDGDSEQALSVLKVDLRHVGSWHARAAGHAGAWGNPQSEAWRVAVLLGTGRAEPGRFAGSDFAWHGGGVEEE